MKKENFIIKIKKEGVLYDYIYASHPFDVAGWDGYNYPYAFSIHDFEPITGRLHQPPPVHQTFETSAFVICSFLPRFMIITLKPFQLHTTIAILIRMKFYTMWMVIL